MAALITVATLHEILVSQKSVGYDCDGVYATWRLAIIFAEELQVSIRY